MAKKSDTPPLSLTMAGPGVVVLTGNLISRDASGVVFNSKKPRSSKRITQHIGYDKLVYVTDTEIGFKGEVTLFSMEVSGIKAADNGLLMAEGEEGTIYYNPAFVSDASAEGDGDGAKKGGGKKAKADKPEKKGKKPKGKKKKGWDKE